MAKYALKILVDLDAIDAIDVRATVRELLEKPVKEWGEAGLREITLRDIAGRKSMRLNPDGGFLGEWKG